MMTKTDTKTLMKILIGAAWLDGVIQIEEREYLMRVAREQGLEQDKEIYPLLHELRSVSAQECYDWIWQYLGKDPTAEDCHRLIEAISALIYSDGTVANEEAKLLTQLQSIELHCGEGACSRNLVLDTVRKVYARWVAVLDSH
ncbi:TerB family tellurite resistance protein [Alkalinema sp. FACHB-956]|uniref:tellurite resistance TerB family protein n=1 Tax=Alkalinema sp. FACHB-956 TaxID=2692768 RepID=UPI001688170A|nr:TerB family tellurite resistance protein [Alkalinema sp. FACHB-956]MBD2329785.1 TerB family tellurite resistance protein [Alkalinema sp. FACHB-956]